jgi:hypothetical protein
VNGAVVTLVVGALALVMVVGVAAGLDPYAIVVVPLIVAVGALAIAVARRAGTGAVSPARCPACGGLLSSETPYCKHCGTRLRRSPD